MSEDEKFIQHLKKGALHSQLGIPESTKIPNTLVNTLANAKVGDTITNPTKIGKEEYKVTELLHERAVTARTLKGLRK